MKLSLKIALGILIAAAVMFAYYVTVKTVFPQQKSKTEEIKEDFERKLDSIQKVTRVLDSIEASKH